MSMRCLIQLLLPTVQALLNTVIGVFTQAPSDELLGDFLSGIPFETWIGSVRRFVEGIVVKLVTASEHGFVVALQHAVHTVSAGGLLRGGVDGGVPIRGRKLLGLWCGECTTDVMKLRSARSSCFTTVHPRSKVF